MPNDMYKSPNLGSDNFRCINNTHFKVLIYLCMMLNATYFDAINIIEIQVICQKLNNRSKSKRHLLFLEHYI